MFSEYTFKPTKQLQLDSLPERVMENHISEEKDVLIKDLLKMLEQGSLNDVKIQLSDGEITANKDILMARSVYFATMFSNNKFMEGETSSVNMSHCSKAVMEKVVKFLFSGTVSLEDLSLAQLFELSHVSEMMLLDKFKDKVEDYTTFNIHLGAEGSVHFLSELILGWKIADKYKLDFIGSYIMLTVYQNLKDILNDDKSLFSIKTLPFHLMREIVVYNSSFLPECNLHTKLKFEAFMVWRSENKITKEEMNEIAGSFNFEDFTVEELMTSVRDSGIYPGSKIDKRVIELVKNQDKLLKEKDLKIQEQDLKIHQQRNILEDAKRYMPSHLLYRFRS